MHTPQPFTVFTTSKKIVPISFLSFAWFGDKEHPNILCIYNYRECTPKCNVCMAILLQMDSPLTIMENKSFSSSFPTNQYNHYWVTKLYHMAQWLIITERLPFFQKYRPWKRGFFPQTLGLFCHADHTLHPNVVPLWLIFVH